MDIQLEKKRGIQKKHLPYVGGGVLFLALVGWIIFGDHASTLKVDARGISIGEVTKEQFNDFVRVNGQVQPITVVQLSPEEGGIVQEKVVEEGAQVKKGDVIIRLSNSSLDLQILDAEAQLAEHTGGHGTGQTEQSVGKGTARCRYCPFTSCLFTTEEIV